MRIIQVIPSSWKKDFNNRIENINNFIIQNHHLVKSQQNCCVSRLNSKEIYDIFMQKNVPIPSFHQYYHNLCRDVDLGWKNMYILCSSSWNLVRVFRYKLLNNVLYLKKMLLKFGKVGSSLSIFCKKIDQTATHLFCEYHITYQLWNQLRCSFKDNLTFHHWLHRVPCFDWLIGLTTFSE